MSAPFDPSQWTPIDRSLTGLPLLLWIDPPCSFDDGRSLKVVIGIGRGIGRPDFGVVVWTTIEGTEIKPTHSMPLPSGPSLEPFSW